jgi:transcriptional antiterminator NusG
MVKHWYVVHTYSGYENKAKLALEERIKSLQMEEFFGDVIVPSENVSNASKGGKKVQGKQRKSFPGYILVQMVLNDETWHVVKDTPKVTGFVGGTMTTPPIIPDDEVLRITSQASEKEVAPRPTEQFQKGENIKVIEGPFSNFSGIVDEVKPEKGKLRVLVSIFGRATPVELDFGQVEKT